MRSLYRMLRHEIDLRALIIVASIHRPPDDTNNNGIGEGDTAVIN